MNLCNANCFWAWSYVAACLKEEPTKNCYQCFCETQDTSVRSSADLFVLMQGHKTPLFGRVQTCSCSSYVIQYMCRWSSTGVDQLERKRTTGSTILIQGCDDLNIVNRIIRTMSLRTQTMFSCKDTLMLNMCLLIRRIGLGKVSSILHLAQRLTGLWM